MTDADAEMVEIMYLTIQRRYQIQNLQSIDRKEWPTHATLLDYKSRQPRDPDYYRPVDYFFPLGEWLHDHQALQRKEREAAKADQERQQRSQSQFARR